VIVARQIGRLVGFIAAALAFYAVLAFGASIFGSYRYEPSGVQYAFLPGLVAPLLLVTGSVLAWFSRRLAGKWLLALLPFVAALVAFALPSFSLADAMLETGRWLLVGVGVLHAALSVRAIRTFWSFARPA
jgi:hypothetical protein